MSFSLPKHYLELYITDNALKVSPSLYCFTTSISHGVEIISPGSLYCFTTSISHGVEIMSPGCGVQASLMLFFSKMQNTKMLVSRKPC